MQPSRSTNVTVDGDITTTGSFNNINIGLFHGQEDHAAKVKRCRDALFLSDPEIDRARLISEKGKRVDGTCEWIRKDKAYKTWRSGDTNLLWINGGPGKGKTILSIFLTQELQRKFSKDATFYFCSNNNQERNNAAAVLRGLMWHVTEKRPQLADVLLEHLIDENRRHITLNSPETLWSIFVKMLRDPRVGTTYCVLDGLDECDEDSQRWLVAKLVELASVDRPGSSNAAFKIAIISRPDVSGLNRCTKVRLDPDNDKQVGKDIQAFVSSRVRELASIVSLPPELLHEVQTTLLDRSEGTFLWVGFAMVELLKKKTATQIQKALYSLPKGLPGIYGRMLLQIEEEDRHTSLLILRWITLAFRPLSLSELAAAVGTQTPPLLTPMQAVRDQISMCGALVKVEGKTASLVHQSARDYLLRSNRDDDEILERFRIKPRQSHTELAAACVDYLVQTNDQYQEVASNAHGWQGWLKAQRRFRLRDYAVEHWPEHAKAFSTAGTKLFANGKFFDEESCAREVWWEEYSWRLMRLPRRFSALHVASYLGILPWAQELIERRKEQLSTLQIRGYVDQQDEFMRTPLWWAADGGHDAVVRLLLATGNVDIDGANCVGETPFFRAAEGGHEAVIQLLLASGKVNADATNSLWKRTPLWGAANSGREELVRLLLAMGNVDVDRADNQGETPLFRAAIGGQKVVVQLLLATEQWIAGTRR
ncbi:hypothetical protein NU195Hw_Modified_11t1 [Hortaea werneckii]